MLRVRALSLKETVFDQEVTMVILPGVEGDLSILSYHVPLCTFLRCESFSIHHADTITEIPLPFGGIVYMDEHNVCTILMKDAPDDEIPDVLLQELGTLHKDV